MSGDQMPGKERVGLDATANGGAAVPLIPLWVKVVCTAFVCLYVPKLIIEVAYVKILWLCNVTLIGLLLALWIENRLIASMMAVSSVLVMLGWTLDFVTGGLVLGFVSFMFDSNVSLYQRILLLDHVLLAPMLLWTVYRLGYDRRAPLIQGGLMVIVFLMAYWFGGPVENINWVYGPGEPQSVLPPLVYLAIFVVVAPIALCGPTHLLLVALFDRRRATSDPKLIKPAFALGSTLLRRPPIDADRSGRGVDA